MTLAKSPIVSSPVDNFLKILIIPILILKERHLRRERRTKSIVSNNNSYKTQQK